MPTHAVVLGGSIAGLVTARVLRDHFDRVTIIERDTNFDQQSSDPSRRGTPQAGHLHLLLEGGRRCLDAWFPGFSDELVRAGAHRCDAGRGLRFYLLGGWRVACDSGIEMYTQSRHLLERVLRGRALALDGIELRTGLRAEDLLFEGGKVCSVRLKGAGDEAKAEDLELDFVVDASGRASKLPVWLKAKGFGEAPLSKVELGIRYASQFVRLPEEKQPPWNAVAIYGPRPEHQRHGVALRIEEGLWFFGATGYGLAHGPRDEDEMRAHLDGLPDPLLAEMYAGSEKLTEVRPFNFPSQQWRRYDRLPKLPGNLAVVGDSLCSLDPVFGQGMTMACLEAELLGEQLSRPSFNPMRTAKAMAQLVAPVWANTSTEALRYDFVEGERPSGGALGQWLSTKLTDRLYLASAQDEEVYRRFSAVLHMVAPLHTLLTPGMLYRLMRTRPEA